MNTTALAFPTAEEEIWRYSRIEELDFASYQVGATRTDIEHLNGVRLAQPQAQASLGIAMVNSPDVFAQLNTDNAEVIALKIERNVVVPQTILITHSLEQSGIVAYPRLTIDVGENSEVTVVERFVSTDDVKSIVVPVVELRAAQAARVTYLAINELGRQTWQISHQQAVGDRDSTMRLFSVALGGDYARVRAEVRLVGQGASAQQTALYFADGSQMHDFRTWQVHVAPRTHSDLLFKGAVKDTARSVYTGLIKIGEHAAGSQAFQTNRNLTLSHGAWAQSVPNLEIETNDVKCSHASTIGPIDEDQRFYLESRGIPPHIAERLVVLGFFDEVINRLPESSFIAGLRAQVSAKLGSNG
ncbi:MAG: Fe-S cluster assembly protein SufD [Ilumatobacteraceae bacterium]